MPERLYEIIDGGLSLKAWTDPRTWVKADIEAELVEVEKILALDPSTFADLQTFNPHVNILEIYEDRWERLKNILDFFGYDTVTREIVNAKSAWYTPVAVEDKCGQVVGKEAVLSIDGDIGTVWGHSVDHEHHITYRLRDWNKRISKMEVYIPDAATHRLTGVNVSIAKKLANIDEPDRVVATGLDFTAVDAWEGFDIQNATGKFIKLWGFQSAHSENKSRIAEIRFQVRTIEY